MEISSLDDIQKLEAKDLREILKSNSKSTGGIRADLVSKVYALLMWHVLPSSSGENRELLTDVQDLEQNQSDFKYEATMVRISALGWSSDLRNLPETNFIQLYDYPVVSWKYRHIVFRGTHCREFHVVSVLDYYAIIKNKNNNYWKLLLSQLLPNLCQFPGSASVLVILLKAITFRDFLC